MYSEKLSLYMYFTLHPVHLCKVYGLVKFVFRVCDSQGIDFCGLILPYSSQTSQQPPPTLQSLANINLASVSIDLPSLETSFEPNLMISVLLG